MLWCSHTLAVVLAEAAAGALLHKRALHGALQQGAGVEEGGRGGSACLYDNLEVDTSHLAGLLCVMVACWGGNACSKQLAPRCCPALSTVFAWLAAQQEHRTHLNKPLAAAGEGVVAELVVEAAHLAGHLWAGQGAGPRAAALTSGLWCLFLSLALLLLCECKDLPLLVQEARSRLQGRCPGAPAEPCRACKPSGTCSRGCRQHRGCEGKEEGRTRRSSACEVATEAVGGLARADISFRQRGSCAPRSQLPQLQALKHTHAAVAPNRP